MIYILSGNDTKKKSIYLKKLSGDDSLVVVYKQGVKRENILEQASSVSLFGESPVVILEEVIRDTSLDLKDEDLLIMKDSKTTFIFLEDKILASDLKKYKKFASIEDFTIIEQKQPPKINVFGVADAFGRRDKMGTWILYREAITSGVSPEEISGIIFWKIKNMILSGTKYFKEDELKVTSSKIVSLYHRAHMGECDFTIGLEQFILSSLSK